jgi:hypothetical protein
MVWTLLPSLRLGRTDTRPECDLYECGDCRSIGAKARDHTLSFNSWQGPDEHGKPPALESLFVLPVNQQSLQADAE